MPSAPIESIIAIRYEFPEARIIILTTYAGDETLTSREIDVLRLIAAGCANNEIAAQLSITGETVKSRVKNILLNSAPTTEHTPSRPR